MADWDVTQLTSLEHDISNGTYNSLARIDATHFVLSYVGASGYGYVKTFSIAEDGTVTEIDSLKYTPSTYSATYSCVCVLDGTHFMVACNTNADGYLFTFSYDANYNNITLIDTLLYDSGGGQYSSIVKIDSNHVALAFMASYGYLATFSFDSNYDNITEIDRLQTGIAYGNDNSLVKTDNTHLLLAFADNPPHGFIKTYSIDSSCDNITEIDSLEFDATNGTMNSLVMIDLTHFILAYAGEGNDGYIRTFSIDANCDNITPIAVTEHDTTLGYYNSLQKIDSTHFILAYSGSGTDGYVKVFSIDDAYGNITQISSIEHDETNGTWNSAAYYNTQLYLAYSGVDTDGFVKVFSVAGAPIEAPEDPFEPPIFSHARLKCWNGTEWISATY